ncbi:MAG: DUF4160 domain-containing protein [Gemmatimonadota bacterium]|nr:DUF4160 domain-containing protein [Gemmatimonadota bacterium]
MPELCRFYGIVIRMYFSDHGPPHFHALYGDQEALVEIDSLAVFQGRLSSRAKSLVIEWASLHQEELRTAWERASRLEPPGKIAPLE